MRIIDRVDELLKERGQTGKELATAIGISPGNITEWRKDRGKPTADVLAKLADFFSVSTDYLLGLTDQRRSGEVAAASSPVPYEDLPPEALAELETFKAFLRSKYGKN